MEKPYRLGLYEKAMPGNLSWAQKLACTKEAGFDFMEISIDETQEKLSRLDYGPEELGGILSEMQRQQVFIRTMCLSGHRKYPLGSPDEETRKKSLQIMEKAVDFAHVLGIRIIQLAGYDVYYEESTSMTRRWFQENLKTCVDMAAKKGVILAFETMETPFMDTVEKSMDYVTSIGSPFLGVYPDMGNLTNAAVSYHGDVLDDIRKGKGHIFAAHLKETVPGVFREVPFGTGHTDFTACIRELLRQGVHLYTGEFWYVGSKDWKDDLRFASRFLRGHIESALESV